MWHWRAPSESVGVYPKRHDTGTFLPDCFRPASSYACTQAAKTLVLEDGPATVNLACAVSAHSRSYLPGILVAWSRSL